MDARLGRRDGAKIAAFRRTVAGNRIFRASYACCLALSLLVAFVWFRTYRTGMGYSYMEHVREYDVFGTSRGLTLVRTFYDPEDVFPDGTPWEIGTFKDAPKDGVDSYQPSSWTRTEPVARKATMLIPLYVVLGPPTLLLSIWLGRSWRRAHLRPSIAGARRASDGIGSNLPNRLLKMCNGVSMLACAVIIFLWARSYHVGYDYTYLAHSRQYGIYTDSSRLVIDLYQYPVTAHDPDPLGTGWVFGPYEPPSGPGPRLYRPWNMRRLGFDFYHRDGDVTTDELYIPLWLLAALTMLPPALQFRRYLRRLWRRRAGLCPRCGYDLRASTDRCPECGTPIPSDKSGIPATATTGELPAVGTSNLPQP